jgi:pyridoxine 5-phosphate synthase
MKKKLGVNIDHVATLRQARQADYPDPVQAAAIAEKAGADSITVHLREDRRHIQDRDIVLLRKSIRTRMNLEMALNPGIIKIALNVRPDEVCIVPERRQEVTTEGGLDAAANLALIGETVKAFHKKGVIVSLFIDPDKKQIDAAKETGSDSIEIHTGSYANADSRGKRKKELEKIVKAAVYAHSLGLTVNAGHGLNYDNLEDIVKIGEIETLNIGHSIIARAVFSGLDKAVRDMKKLI